jgi:hypothetical protein
MWKQLSAKIPELLCPCVMDEQRRHAVWLQLLQTQLTYGSQHHTKASSTVTLLGRTLGMVKRFAPLLGRRIPAWDAEMKRLELKSRQEPVKRATPLTHKLVSQIATQLGQIERCWLYVAWACAARGSSVTKLRPRNVFPNPWQADNSKVLHDLTALTFVEGKTITSTGAYTIHARLPPDVRASLVKLRRDRSRCKFLFPSKTQSRVAAELAKHGMDIRSIRRGALQAMALAGSKPDVIRSFSRHTDNKGLAAYLDSGLTARWEAMSQAKAGRALTPSL